MNYELELELPPVLRLLLGKVRDRIFVSLGLTFFYHKDHSLSKQFPYSTVINILFPYCSSCLNVPFEYRSAYSNADLTMWISLLKYEIVSALVNISFKNSF